MTSSEPLINQGQILCGLNTMELASLYKPKIWPQVSRSFESGWPNTGIFMLWKNI